KRLHKELYINVNYHPISVDDYMYELAKQPKKMQKSFVKPRKKEKSKFVLTTLIVLTLLITFSAFYFYSYMSVKKEGIKEEILLEKDKTAQELERQKKEALNPTLPNHLLKNSIVQQRVLTLFELIPYSVVLDELELEMADSKMKVTLLEDD